MFNYMVEQEKVFLDHYQKIFHQRIGRHDVFVDLFENLNFYLQYLWVPFSPISFSSQVFDLLKEIWLDDAFNILSPFFMLFMFLIQEKHDILELLCGIIISSLYLAVAFIDLTAQMVLLSLSIVTRSLATIAYLGHVNIGENSLFDRKNTLSCSVV